MNPAEDEDMPSQRSVRDAVRTLLNYFIESCITVASFEGGDYAAVVTPRAHATAAHPTRTT